MATSVAALRETRLLVHYEKMPVGDRDRHVRIRLPRLGLNVGHSTALTRYFSLRKRLFEFSAAEVVDGNVYGLWKLTGRQFPHQEH